MKFEQIKAGDAAVEPVPENEIEHSKIFPERSPGDLEGVITRLGKRYPRLRSLVAGFVIASAGLIGGGTIAAERPIPETQTITYKLKAPEKKLNKIKDQEFKAEVAMIRAEIAEVDIEIPPESFYGYSYQYTAVEKKQSVNAEQRGTLPDSVKNVVIGSKSRSGKVFKLDSEQKWKSREYREAIINDSVFYVTEAESDSMNEGDTFEIRGVGASREQALRFALENGMETSVENSERYRTERSVDSDRKKHPFSEKILMSDVYKSQSERIIYSYEVINEEHIEEGDHPEQYIVTVRITEGIPALENSK